MTDRKVLLIQIDGKWPNLALMKISAFHKQMGDDVAMVRSRAPAVGLIPFDPDMVYLSCIFGWNRGFAMKVCESFLDRGTQFLISGGTGFGRNLLPEAMEHLMPDYSLYDLDYSIGFTTRGCYRRCPWCLVPKLEGKFREHASIEEFLHPDHDKLILWDNNLTWSEFFGDKMRLLIDRGIKTSFNQGLDIRLMDESKARLLSEVKYYNPHFNKRRLYFSFDEPYIEEELTRGVQILFDAGIPPIHLMFYMLCGFNTTHEEDMHRFRVLDGLGVDPFVMIYNNRYDDPWIRHFARWVNQRKYKSCEWGDYDHGNSREIIQRDGTV